MIKLIIVRRRKFSRGINYPGVSLVSRQRSVIGVVLTDGNGRVQHIRKPYYVPRGENEFQKQIGRHFARFFTINPRHDENEKNGDAKTLSNRAFSVPEFVIRFKQIKKHSGYNRKGGEQTDIPYDLEEILLDVYSTVIRKIPV